MKRVWLLVGLLSATAMASYLSRVNLSVAGALMMKDFGLSQVHMGTLFSAFILGYALFQVPAGLAADRWGARRVLAWATAAWVAVLAAIAAVSAYWALLVLRFVLGVAEAPTFPSSAHAVSRFVPGSRQGRANGLVIASIGLGSAIAPPLLTPVMVHWGWRVAILVSALPALAVAAGWVLMRQPDPKHAVPLKHQGGGDGRLVSRSFALLTLSYTLQGYVGYIFVFWFYLYLVDVRHFDLLRSAALSAMPWVFSIVSIPLGGIISDRLVETRLGLNWGRRLVPMVAFTGSGIFLAIGAHTGNPWIAAVSLAISTALVLCVEGAFWATLMRIAGPRSGTAGGFMNMGSNIGGLISPTLTPMLATFMGWENALLIAAAVSIVAGLLWFGVTAAPSQADY